MKLQTCAIGPLFLLMVLLITCGAWAQYPPVGCYNAGVLCDSVKVDFSLFIEESYEAPYWNGSVRSIASHLDVLGTEDMADYNYVSRGGSTFYISSDWPDPVGRLSWVAGSTGYQSPSGFSDMGSYIAAYLQYNATNEWYAMWTVSDGTPVSIPDTTATNGLTVYFNGTRSYEAEDGQKVPVVEYDWYFGVEGGVGAGPAPAYTYPEPGTYTVRLVVTDDDGDMRTTWMSFDLGPPDLTVKAKVVESSQPDFRLTVGDSVLVRAEVINTGQAPVYNLNIPNSFNMSVSFPSSTDGFYQVAPVYEALGEDSEITIPVLNEGEMAPPVERWYKVTSFASYLESGTYYPVDVVGYPIMTRAKGENLDGDLVVAQDVCEYELCDQSWEVRPPGIEVEEPSPDGLVIGGVPIILRWDRDIPGAVSRVTVTLVPDTLGSSSTNLIFATDIDSLHWSVPDDLFSRSARIIVKSFNNPAIADTTDFFKIKPYHLTRLIDDGARYEPFEVDRHGWNFSNSEPNLFPSSWWATDPQFNYESGTDPFTNLPYDYSTMRSTPKVFEDWPAYVRAFGTDDAYWYFIPGITAFYNESFLAQWRMSHGGAGWNGSCSGMSVAALLMFGHQDAFGTKYPLVGAADELGSLALTLPVRESINSLFSYWGGRRAQVAVQSVGTNSVRQTLFELKDMLLSDSRNLDRYLYMEEANYFDPADPENTGRGAHAVVPVRLERFAGTEGFWLLHIYDPNLPATDAVVLLDSLSNEWSYEGFDPVWYGDSGLFLMDEIPNYLQEAVVYSQPQVFRGKGHPAEDGDRLLVGTIRGADAILTALDGSGSLSYIDSLLTNDIESAFPVFAPVGGYTEPQSYNLPLGAYSLNMSVPPDSLVSATFLAPDLIYSYDRSDGQITQTDQLTFDPAANNGGGSLMVQGDGTPAARFLDIRAVLTDEPTRERTLMVHGLALVQADSVNFEVLDASGDSQLHLRNQGASTSYHLRVRQASRLGGETFMSNGIALPAGATHIIRPVWSALFETDLELEVDLDSNGTVDQVLTLVNVAEAQVTPVGSDDLPTVVKLHAPYPNPFNGQSTVQFEVPKAGHVKVALFDLRGRLVDVLVDAQREAGHYQTTVQSKGLASGVYLVRMEAGNTVQTQLVTLVQ